MLWALAVTLAGLLAVLWVALRLRRAIDAARAAQHSAQRERDAALGALTQAAARADHTTHLLESVLDGFFVLDEDYRFKEVNAAFCRLTGFSATELRSMRMTDLEVDTLAADGRTDELSGAGHHLATTHRHRDGHLIQLETCLSVVRDGDARRLIGFARDVTERQRSEQALRASEAQYRNLVEMSRDLIWSLDAAGSWTFVNNAARAIYGQEPSALLGRPFMEAVHPEFRPATQQKFDELRAGKPRLRFETQHLRRNGEAVHLSVNAIAIRNDAGEVVGFTGTASDITERRAAEAQLHEAHARFESLVAGMPLGYIVWSTDFRVLEWNPAASSIYGYPIEQALGARAIDLLVPEDGRAAFSKLGRALLSGQWRASTVLVNRRADGEKIRCEWYCTVLPDAQGRPQAIAALVRDVSERERLEGQLRQSQKLESLGVLAGGVAHDFNNLLVGIMGNASLAMENLPADSRLRPLLERVVNAGRRATDLTQRMLAYAGRSTCDVQVMNLNDLVQEMADFALAAIPKNVTVSIQTADVPLIRADSGQVQQIIMNLLINAAEAIGTAGGQVTVSTWAEALDAARITADFADQRLTPGAYVCLEVRDTGCGMTPEILGRIFDPFFTTKFAGRGLGLSAILGIVKAHRGAITVRSEVGVGTVFQVLFPAVAATAAPARSSAPPAPLRRGTTVLVIDDEEEIRDVVQAVLEQRGLRVLTAEDGRRGIEVFRAETTIDAVLLDLNMPDMNGEAVFQVLRTIRPDVKVLLSTGYSEQETSRLFADAPLAGFVHKPYTASALVDKIGAALATN
jgi:two-component system, cell cycle sensor histidine kinase and response regulator CckA